MLKVGIIGTFTAIAARIKQWEQIEHVQVEGILLLDDGGWDKSCIQVREYETAQMLIAAVDIVDIVSDQPDQVDYIYQAILFQKHLFLHNPFVIASETLQHIAKLIQEAKIKCQVGLYLRFLDMVQQIPKDKKSLQFIEVKCAYSKNSLAHNWFLVINNHIDMVWTLLRSQVRKLYANHVMIQDDRKDLVNARIQFDNGAVGNITVNTCAIRSEHILSLYGKNYMADLQVTETEDTGIPQSAENVALASFISDIQQDSVVKVTIFDAINSVELTTELVKQIEA